ncbi:TPR-like protein [Martensiomyces pterosporus]|nr:TPR-like protein [Martensiomyces pterosporus]
MDSSLEALRAQLREAVDECTSRGLLFSAKWAAEQLCSLPARDAHAATADFTPEPAMESSEARERRERWKRSDAEDRDRFAMAKCLFDMREFDRAAFYLQDCQGPRAQFLRLYSRYLSRERRTCESGAAGSQAHRSQDRNAAAADRELLAIRDELQTVDGENDLDSFGLYLLAMVHKALGQLDRARDTCLRSVRLFEYNWSAWLLLEACVDLREPLEKLGALLPSGWMRHAFLAHLLLELFTSGSEEFTMHYQVLERLFPQSPFVIGLRAVRHYNMREFEEANALFATLQNVDPYRLELSDIHSNILYVMEDRARLGQLAHRCASLDRFRPETCCVIGNYYSLRREHEKAVGYFQRALQLDRNYLAAWTLMGHEYIEMKNTAAAIDAYRHAVDVDERDYRAWYGLGQTYEMLNMPHYALNYYMRAAALRPYDSRMWCALANCYELSGRPEQAIDCYRRALIGTSESEQLAISRLAKLYVDGGDKKLAAYYYQLLYEHAIKNSSGTADAGGQQGDELAGACIYLASFEQERGNVEVAQQYLAQVVDGASGGASAQRVEEAKAMMRAMMSDIQG